MRRGGKIWDKWARIQGILKGRPDGLEVLTTRQKRVLDRIRRDDKASLDEIGRELGISRERVRQHVEKALWELERFLAAGAAGCIPPRRAAVQRRRSALLRILKARPKLADELTELQRRAIAALEERPTATQEELGRAMGSTGFAWKSHFNGVVNRVERTTDTYLEDY